ncbi:MAG: GAF domain-containing protein [Planctomycetes bacterium]|nr:GAF domain-containing protein [Planctomycetota bacterium]
MKVLCLGIDRSLKLVCGDVPSEVSLAVLDGEVPVGGRIKLTEDDAEIVVCDGDGPLGPLRDLCKACAGASPARKSDLPLPPDCLPIILLVAPEDNIRTDELRAAGAFEVVHKGEGAADSLRSALHSAVCYRAGLADPYADLFRYARKQSRRATDKSRILHRLDEKHRIVYQELHHVNRLLATKMREVEALHDIGQGISALMEVNGLLTLIMETSKDLMKAEASSLMLLDGEKRELYFEVARGAAGEKVKKMRVKLGQGIAGTVAETGQPLIVNDAYADKRFSPDYDRKTGFRTRALCCVPLKSRDRVIGIVQVINKRDGSLFTNEDLKTFTSFASQASIAIENARLYTDLKEALERERWLAIERDKMGKYVPKNVIDDIHRNREKALAMGGRIIDGTILFADIVGYTTRTQHLPPEQVVSFLNEYLNAIVGVIEDHGGILDKFIGDGVMAVYVADSEKDNPTLRAVASALKMQDTLKSLNRLFVSRGIPELQIRIGINCGPVISGNIGKETRLDYTVIGANVNLASRLESSCTPGAVHVSQEVHSRLKGLIVDEFRGSVSLKGFDQPVPTYEVRSIVPTALRPGSGGSTTIITTVSPRG